eukprot:534506-Amphidinium_carterae.1
MGRCKINRGQSRSSKKDHYFTRTEAHNGLLSASSHSTSASTLPGTRPTTSSSAPPLHQPLGQAS